MSLSFFPFTPTPPYLKVTSLENDKVVLLGPPTHLQDRVTNHVILVEF